MPGFGVRQLAAAFSGASLLAPRQAKTVTVGGQQAGLEESGSKLPHSKAGHPPGKRAPLVAIELTHGRAVPGAAHIGEELHLEGPVTMTVFSLASQAA